MLWLNHAVNRLWRIKHAQADRPLDFPPFVTRAFRTDSEECYGGLEPSISAAIGSGLVNALEKARTTRPTDIAYVSLYSLSLGGRPPVIRSIKWGNEIVNDFDDLQQVELDLEVDAFMEDLSMIFGKQSR